MKKILLLTLSLFMSYMLFGQTQTTIYPEKDAYVSSFYPSTNFGTETDLFVQVQEDPWYPSSLQEILIHFDLDVPPASSPYNADVTSAMLYLYGIGHSGMPYTTLYAAGASWSESSVTWSNKPSNAGGPNSVSLPAPTDPYMDYTLDVIDIVDYWLINDNNYGFLIYNQLSQGGTATPYLKFASREYPTSTKHPKLILNFNYNAPTAHTGTIWYVSESIGNDTWGVGTQAYPFRTIQHALDQCGTDHTVIVAAGNYNEHDLDWPSYNGITLQGAGSTATIVNATSSGRVMRIDNVSSGEIKEIKFINGAEANGAGVYLNNADINFEDIVITNNIASASGGGLYIVGGSIPIFNNVIIENNNALFGAGLYSNNSNINFDDGSISENECIAIGAASGSSYGGGIYSLNSTIDLSGVDISKNIVHGWYSDNSFGGGGIYSSGSTINLTNVLISENEAGDESHSQYSYYCNVYGGGIYSYSSDIDLNQVTLAGNVIKMPVMYGCIDEGGGIYSIGSSEISLINSICFNNTWLRNNNYNPEANNIYNSGTLNIDYTNLEGGQANILGSGGTINYGTTNITDDPSFATDFYLNDNSPCIMAGTLYNCPSDDLDGNPRPIPSITNPDLGAYENAFGISCIGSTTICEGESVTLTTSFSIPNYQWYKNNLPISGATSSTYSPTQSGTYNCDINGIISNSISITVNPTPPLQASVAQDVSCIGATDGSASAVSGFCGPCYVPWTYEWNTSPPQTTHTATNLEAGDYSVTVTNILGCSTVALPVTVGQPTPLSVSFDCNGGCSCMKGYTCLEATVMGGTPPYTTTSGMDNQGNGVFTICINTSVPISHYFYFEDANGCTVSGGASCYVPQFRSAEYLIEASESITLKVYPNPAQNKLFVELENNEAKVDLRLFDVTGRMIISKAYFDNNEIELDLTSLPSGTYSLVIDTESFHKKEVVIIE